MAGKGSKQRPTDKKKFDENFSRIFGTKEKPKPLTDDEIVGDIPTFLNCLKHKDIDYEKQSKHYS